MSSKQGFKFTLTTNGNKVHPAFARNGVQFTGTMKVRGERPPHEARDFFRCVRYLMWGNPLDEPVDLDLEDRIWAAVQEIQAEQSS